MPETTLFGTPLLTSQEREDNATDFENTHGYVAGGLYGGCPECQRAYGMDPREFFHAVHESQELYDEGSFSWHDCDLCGSRLGGDRFAAHATQVKRNYDTPSEPGTTLHLDVCWDCLNAMANGEPYPNEQEEPA